MELYAVFSSPLLYKIMTEAGYVVGSLEQTFVDKLVTEMISFLRRSERSIKIEPDRALWWTFAGGQINHTLKYGIQFQEDWKIVSDNFGLKIEGSRLSPKSLYAAIARMSTDDFWNDPSSKHFIRAQLPEYRLSKFQIALPEDYCSEMIRDYLLDIPGAARFLHRA